MNPSKTDLMVVFKELIKDARRVPYFKEVALSLVVLIVAVFITSSSKNVDIKALINILLIFLATAIVFLVVIARLSARGNDFLANFILALLFISAIAFGVAYANALFGGECPKPLAQKIHMKTDDNIECVGPMYLRKVNKINPSQQKPSSPPNKDDRVSSDKKTSIEPKHVLIKSVDWSFSECQTLGKRLKYILSGVKSIYQVCEFHLIYTSESANLEEICVKYDLIYTNKGYPIAIRNPICSKIDYDPVTSSSSNPGSVKCFKNGQKNHCILAYPLGVNFYPDRRYNTAKLYFTSTFSNNERISDYVKVPIRSNQLSGKKT